MNALLDDLLADLTLEGLELREVVAGLSESGWRTATPAAGWDVATQIAHLAWTDEAALAAAATNATWDEMVAEAQADPEGYVDAAARGVAAVPSTELLTRWDRGRTALAEVLRSYPEGQRVAWFGPPMSPASMATARFMETWAHGLDVREGLGIEPTPSDRVRHVCHLGVRTRAFAHAVHGREAPAEPRVELTAPSGATWTWGPEDAAERITGSGWDFARLVTQRIHRDDTDLVADGADAAYWLGIAQAFAGPPGQGREATGGRERD